MSLEDSQLHSINEVNDSRAESCSPKARKTTKRSSTNLRFDFSPKIEVMPESRVEKIQHDKRESEHSQEQVDEHLLNPDYHKMKKQNTLGVKKYVKDVVRQSSRGKKESSRSSKRELSPGKSKTIERQFTISSISSINCINKKKEKMRIKNKGDLKDAIEHEKAKYLIKNKEEKVVNKHTRNTHRFKELKLDPSALCYLKSKCLSPITRANIALHKSPAKIKKKKSDFDLSTEKSYDKNHNKEDEVQLDFRNDNIYTIFSSSKSSTHNDEDQALLKIIEKDSSNILRTNSPNKNSLERPSHNPEVEFERIQSSSKSPLKSIQPTLNRIRSNKKIIDEFYSKIKFKPELYGINMYCPGMNAKLLQDFFSVKLVKQQTEIQNKCSANEYYHNGKKNQHQAQRKLEELMLIKAISSSI